MSLETKTLRILTCDQCGKEETFDPAAFADDESLRDYAHGAHDFNGVDGKDYCCDCYNKTFRPGLIREAERRIMERLTGTAGARSGTGTPAPEPQPAR